MKAEQVKNIIDTLLKDADLVCATDKDRIRAYFQGARYMSHALFMNGIISYENMRIVFDKVDKEVDKTFNQS